MSPLKPYNFYLKHFSQKRYFSKEMLDTGALMHHVLYTWSIHFKYFRLGWNWLNNTSKDIRKWFQLFWFNFEGYRKQALGTLLLLPLKTLGSLSLSPPPPSIPPSLPLSLSVANGIKALVFFHLSSVFSTPFFHGSGGAWPLNSPPRSFTLWIPTRGPSSPETPPTRGLRPPARF